MTTDILTRLREATGPDRELDVRIAYALGYQPESLGCSFKTYCDLHERDFSSVARDAERHNNILCHELPRWTASLDASIALVEEMLPGWSWRISKNGCCELLNPEFPPFERLGSQKQAAKRGIRDEQ